MDRSLAAVILATILTGLASTAQAQTPPPRLCLFQTGSPMPASTSTAQRLYVTAQADGQNASNATYNARNRWSQTVGQRHGQAWGNVGYAMFLVTSCRNTGNAFQPKTTCTVKAQPCNRP